MNGRDVYCCRFQIVLYGTLGLASCTRLLFRRGGEECSCLDKKKTGLRYMIILILWMPFEDMGEFAWMMEVDVS
jgi:hypothetical protein